MIQKKNLKIACGVVAVLCAVSLTACGNEPENSAEQSSEVPVREQTSYLFQSLQEYAESEEVQDYAKENTSDQILCEIYAEDDHTLVMKYSYRVAVLSDVYEEVAVRLEESYESQNDYFAEQRAELLDMVNVVDPCIKIVYATQSGYVFSEHTYSSSNYKPVESTAVSEE